MYAYPDNPTIKPQNSVFLRDKQAGWRGFLFGGIMRTCSIEGCEKKYHAKGYCQMHHKRWWKYGNPLITQIEMHGKSDEPEYQIWANMKDRCYRKTHHGYKNYGGRGIKVCDRWRNSFKTFYKDMGLRPFPEAQIDRIDNEGNYEPLNCRWTTRKTNSRNSRWIKLSMKIAIQIRKEYIRHIITQQMLAKKYNVSRHAIKCVLNNQTWT